MAPCGSKQITCPFFVYIQYIYIYTCLRYTKDLPCTSGPSVTGWLVKGKLRSGGVTRERTTGFPIPGKGVLTRERAYGGEGQLNKWETLVYSRLYTTSVKFMFFVPLVPGHERHTPLLSPSSDLPCCVRFYTGQIHRLLRYIYVRWPIDRPVLHPPQSPVRIPFWIGGEIGFYRKSWSNYN